MNGLLDNPNFYGGLAALAALGQAMQPSTMPRNEFGSALQALGAFGQGSLGARNAFARQDLAKSQARERFGNPMAVMQGGDPALVQAGNFGTIRPTEGYQPAPGMTNSGIPSSVQEWMFYNSMPDDAARENYLRMKRANPYLNRGGSLVQPSQMRPGQPLGEIEKTIPPEEEPALKGAQESAKVEARTKAQRAAEAPGAGAKATLRFGPLDRMGQTVDDVLKAPGLDDIVGLKSMVPIIPGTERANAAAKFETLKSQVAQNVLQMYREMSQTGGAVGQVSNFEQQLFQNNLAALDRAQTPKEFRKQLQKIKQFVAESRERIKFAYELQFGQPFPDEGKEGGAPAASQSPDDPLGLR